MPQDLREAVPAHPDTLVPVVVDERLRRSLVTTTAGLRAVGPALDALARAARAPASVASALAAVWLGAHPEESPYVVLVHRGTTLVGAALLTRRRERAWVRFGKAGVQGEPFTLLHTDAEAADALVRAVALSLPRHSSRVVLEDLPEPDRTTRRLAAALPRASLVPTDPVPVLDVSDAPAADGGPRLISRNTRQAVAKATNRARREGRDLVLRWTADPDEVVDALPAVVGLHVRRNADHGRAALLLDPVERAVYEETVVTQARAGRVRLLRTTIDGELAAFALCFTSPGRWWVWSNYADPDWLHYSPGTVSNAEVVRAAAEDPDVDCLDWGSGLQRYKLSGPVHLESRQRLEAAAPAVDRALRAESIARRAGRRLRRLRRLRRR